MVDRPIIVHVVGVGTIGEPLAAMLWRMREQLDIERVSISKKTPTAADTPKIHRLTGLGIRFAAVESHEESFEACGQPVHLTLEQALAEADVVVDCTSEGGGLENKRRWYEHYTDALGFLAQGSETGFGKPYACGVNDSALRAGEDRFIHSVSCNTHTLCGLIRTLGFNGETPNLAHGSFMCMRRANDVSQAGSYVPSPQVGKHSDPRFGTHHALDSHAVFATMGHEFDLFSSAVKLNTQYMHTVGFSLQLEKPLSHGAVVDRLRANPRIGVTNETLANKVFSIGRDWGYFGRLFNYCVVSLPTLWVSQDGRRVAGYAFTPQDGNPLFSTVAGIMWLRDPATYLDRLEPLRQQMVQEI